MLQIGSVQRSLLLHDMLEEWDLEAAQSTRCALQSLHLYAIVALFARHLSAPQLASRLSKLVKLCIVTFRTSRQSRVGAIPQDKLMLICFRFWIVYFSHPYRVCKELALDTSEEGPLLKTLTPQRLF